jgi:hypothetical protein
MKIIIILIIFILIKVTFSPFSSSLTYTLQTPGYGAEVYDFPIMSNLNSSAKPIVLNKTQQTAFVNYMQSDPNIAIFMSDNSIINGTSYNKEIASSSSNNSVLLILGKLSDLYCLNYNEASSSLTNCAKGSLESSLDIAYYIDNKIDYPTYNAIWTALTNRYNIITNNLI